MDGISEDLKNGPQYDTMKDELEWRHSQGERMSQRMPHLLCEMKNQMQKMRPHFQDNSVGLKLWDNHAKEILDGFEYQLPTALSSPMNLPTSVRYEHLMKRKARSTTFVSMLSVGVDKKLVAAGSVIAAVGLAMSFVFRRTTGKQQEAT
ncbi:unnamed protein product [Urochloa decumbens]|uniref:Uncharacterized protein n=1 Tax=Urochloa decumbens TaxID=240449 RepID=A0ABC8X512_9POAL